MPISFDELSIKRIRVKVESITERADSEDILKLLDQFGQDLTAKAKLNAKSKSILDLGRLIGRIKHNVTAGKSKSTLVVGPKGVPYARFQEFGARRTPASRRAMFAELRARGTLGNKQGYPGMTASDHVKRPFLGPALQELGPNFINLLRKVFRNAGFNEKKDPS